MSDRLSPVQHKKVLIRWHKEYIQDLKHMREEEKRHANNTDGEEYSSGRSKWFAKEIGDSEKRIDELKEEVRELRQ